ncbi:hypothetical protein FDH47_gp10 [Arthrobacter phage Brent]|uniref:Uncharacterized protein n=3 Tax=Jawnskivirus TaxID=3425003 RepID=A0A222Z2D3_9CAUD|nr:hypothetical protein FDH47_gp10 [Arthrobacter phage Brent]ALF01221.1 hypothetical protein SEA_BRENT_10 [Arthrobacter phage Brent]ASR78117.1 hypothetical protein SEA_FRANZY_10 [Arthrobacter phage Franzy]QNJ59580.1 hypothetical protein SEA_KING2_10 [Arthrobacter phage King2]
MADPQKWGVTVDEVSALAPHIGLYSPTTEEPVDDVFGETAAGKVSRADVERFITDVAGRVSVRLWQLARLRPDTEPRNVFAQACHDLTVTGAAHYLVAAAFPAQAGINDDTSLAGLLWKRFEDGLDDLAAQLAAIVEDGDDTVVLPRAAAKAVVTGTFPAPMFPDGLRW